MQSNHLILCHPLLLLPSIFSNIRVFSNESALHIRWPKYWTFSFNITHSNEHPGLSSFTMDCLDPHAVQGTLKSILQHHSSKASILWHSAFFTVQLTHPDMTEWLNWTETSRIRADAWHSGFYIASQADLFIFESIIWNISDICIIRLKE